MEPNPKYINLLTDFGFKRIFGTEANVDLLIDFLNSVLERPSKIVRLDFRNVEQYGNLEEDRKAIYDIYCVGENGEEFIVEMQKGKITYFRDRALFYTTFPVQRQAQKGEWNFKLSEVYYIALLDFFYEPEENAQLERVVKLTDQFKNVFYDKLTFYYYQLPAFSKLENQLETRKDKWIFFLKNIESMSDEVVQLFQTDKIFTKMINAAEIAKLSVDEYQKYAVSRVQYMEIKGVYDNAFMEGELAAELKFQQALQEAKNKEREAKMQKDAVTNTFILTLHSMGKSVSEIATLTNTTEVYVQQLLK